MKKMGFVIALALFASGCSKSTIALRAENCIEVKPPGDCEGTGATEDVTVSFRRNNLDDKRGDDAVDKITACVAAGGKVTINIEPADEALPGSVHVVPLNARKSVWLRGSNFADRNTITIAVPEVVDGRKHDYLIIDDEKGCLDPRFHVE